MFKIDYSQLQDNSYSPLPAGVYEVIIQSAKEDATKSGAEKLGLVLVVRNDLKNVPELAETNGKHANRLVFDDHWKARATGEYRINNFLHILKAAGVPEGTPIASIDDLINLFTSKPVRVKVEQEENEYNGKTTTRNTVAPWDYGPTQFPQVNHVDNGQQAKATPAASSPFDNADLPF